MQLTKNLRVSSFQIITGSFLVIILLGAFMLTLPVSSVDGAWTPFGDALFTSTSAVCVTGLVVQDTFRYWSLFGRLIILFLIQTFSFNLDDMMVVAGKSLISKPQTEVCFGNLSR